MSIAISNATITANNIAVGVVPNSVSYTEGLGEYNYRAQSAGGGSVQGVFSVNIEDRLPGLKFSLYNSPENIAVLKQWKLNLNQNIFNVTGQIPNNPNFTRTFRYAAVLNNYDVNLGADTQIDVEIKAESVI